MNIRKYICYLMVAAVLGTAATSCDKEDDEADIILGGGHHSDNGGGSDDDDDDDGRHDDLLEGVPGKLEVPALDNHNIFIEHSSNGVMTYCLEYDTRANHARWVAFRFDSKTRVQSVGRQDDFQDDPKLPSQYWHGASGFGSGHDRGHICASADRLYSKEANRQTFYMTNMSPQESRFNQDYWTGFEAKVQSWGRDKSFADTLYVVKGGTLDQTKGTLSHGGKQVVIPKYYFMAILKCKNNTYSALAFWMEHKNYGIVDPSKSELASKIISIDELEEKTGIDFFHNLPDAAEKVVEAEVNKSAWGF